MNHYPKLCTFFFNYIHLTPHYISTNVHVFQFQYILNNLRKIPPSITYKSLHFTFYILHSTFHFSVFRFFNSSILSFHLQFFILHSYISFLNFLILQFLHSYISFIILHSYILHF